MKKKTAYTIGIAVLIVIVIFLNYGGKMNSIAVFETNMGTFKIELYEDKAPITTANFIRLINLGFYDGTRFHRVISRFMIQGGDPKSKDLSKTSEWGTGGPGYYIKDEFGPGLRNVAGTISMANSGPNTGGSQFFINVAPNTFLDGKHPVFGKVIEGYELVQKISNVETVEEDRPAQDVIIKRITIAK